LTWAHERIGIPLQKKKGLNGILRMEQRQFNLDEISYGTLIHMRKGQLIDLATQVMKMHQEDRQERQLLYYQPWGANLPIHLSDAHTVGVGGGNGSSKTETCLVEMVSQATGVIPNSLRDYDVVRDRFRGPINCRVVCESLTTVLHPIMLPKLKWWQWTGVDAPGGSRGHWGWIPRDCLIGGSWEKSWSEKLRMLRMLCRDPNDYNKVLGESTIQFMSVDQDPSDFASGDFHMVLHDEPPNLGIWTENQARTMRVNGRMFLAMTWPDDPAIPVDWLFDEVYEPGCPGPNKSPDVEWINLYTTDNPHLDQTAVSKQMNQWSEETKNVRIFGKPIRFSNRIHPFFTDSYQTWCFRCGKAVTALEGLCGACESSRTTRYCHVEDFEVQPYPTVFLLDPHPRKPHMFQWIQTSPWDDYQQVAEGEIDGDPNEVASYAFRLEEELRLDVTFRIIDPNMGRSPAGAKRNVTWQDEFAAAGLYCDLADDSDVGRGRFNEFCKPDEDTMAPRLRIHSRCNRTIFQLKRYTWDDYKRHLEKGQKQQAKTINDDFPTLWKYFMNLGMTFDFAKNGAPYMRRMGTPMNRAYRVNR